MVPELIGSALVTGLAAPLVSAVQSWFARQPNVEIQVGRETSRWTSTGIFTLSRSMPLSAWSSNLPTKATRTDCARSCPRATRHPNGFVTVSPERCPAPPRKRPAG